VSPQALLDRIAELEEENRQLREQLAPTLELPAHWRLGPQVATLLRTLVRCAPCSASPERIAAALAPTTAEREWPSHQCILVLVTHLRRALARHAPGVRISNAGRRQGWAIDPDSLVALQRAMTTPPPRPSSARRDPGPCAARTPFAPRANYAEQVAA
jgi:hypothetical protein